MSDQSRLDQIKFLDNITDAVGETPLIRLKHLPAEHGVKAAVLVKPEFLNPTGSVTVEPDGETGTVESPDEEAAGRLHRVSQFPQVGDRHRGLDAPGIEDGRRIALHPGRVPASGLRADHVEGIA